MMDTPAVTASPQASFEEQRGAPRFTLLIRTAKLVCDSGEFLCVLRDVSETGVRLKLFHELPRDPRLALELADGAFYFIERVWEQGGHAGFRFAAPIDAHAFIAESAERPRGNVRLRLELPASVTAEGVTGEARLLDISPEGARIECDRILAVGQKVKLQVEGLPAIIANVLWRSAPEHGLAFQTFFALDELARLTAAVQLAHKPVDAVRFA